MEHYCLHPEQREPEPIEWCNESDLNSIKKSDLTELCAVRRPSDAMKAVFGALGIAFGVGSDWDRCCAALLVDANLIDKIKGYDKDRMSDALIDELSQYINTPLMEPQYVARSSAALVGLSKWVRALVQYGK